MNQYEAMYVIDTQLEETARQELIARFNALVESNGGTVDRVDEWGKRRWPTDQLQDRRLLRADVRHSPACVAAGAGAQPADL
jgi:ribosomal protein S6